MNLNATGDFSYPALERIHALEMGLSLVRRDQRHAGDRMTRLEESQKLLAARVTTERERREAVVGEIQARINGGILWSLIAAGGMVVSLLIYIGRVKLGI